MANAPADGNPLGTTQTPDTYPQWGVKQTAGTPGYGVSASDYATAEAHSAAQKQNLLGQGYDIWFATAAAASSYISGQVGNAANPATRAANSTAAALTPIGDFFGTLTQASTWIRVAKVLAGGLLLIVGLVHITGADNAIASAAKKVPLPV